MNEMNDNNEYDPTLDELFNDINEVLGKFNHQLRERRAKCEQLLEQIVREGKVEILVDSRGYFHYRITDLGKMILKTDGYDIGNQETFIDPWRLA